MTVWFDKSRKRWRYNFMLAGVRYARECRLPDGSLVTSRRAAEACEEAVRVAARTAPKVPAASDLTLAQVIDALAETWIHDADWPNKRRYAREIVAFFGGDCPMTSIDGAKLQDYVAFALKQPVMIWRGGGRKPGETEDQDRYWKPAENGRTRAPATVNRYLPIIRAALQRAHHTRDSITGRRVIEDVPIVADLAEPKRKARPIPDPVLLHLMEILPDYLVEAERLTLYFGLRRGEALSLQVPQVDFQARGIWLDHDAVKDDEDAFLPGGRAAMQFLAQLVDQAKERRMRHLISWRRRRKDETAQAREPWRPLKNPKTAWRTAMDAVQEKFGKRWRWHDLRAAFITHIAITAGPLAAQKLARHSEFSTTQGYVEVADQVMRDAAEQAGNRPAFEVVKGGKTG